MVDKYLEEEEQPEEKQEEVVPDFVKMEDYARLEGKIDALASVFSQQQPGTAEPAPTGPTMAEHIAKYDEALLTLDEAMDKAVADGKPVSEIQRKREEIIQAKADIKYGTQIQELQNFGINAIGSLTDEVIKGQMPDLAHAEVKASYDKALSGMPADQRMNPEARRIAYNFARGENMDRIIELEREKILRDVETGVTTVPGAAAAPALSPAGYPEGVPDPKDHFTQDNFDALDAKGQSVEDFCKSMGYDGWADYYESTIKETEEEK
jgi:hypothetical protein